MLTWDDEWRKNWRIRLILQSSWSTSGFAKEKVFLKLLLMPSKKKNKTKTFWLKIGFVRWENVGQWDYYFVLSNWKLLRKKKPCFERVWFNGISLLTIKHVVWNGHLLCEIFVQDISCPYFLLHSQPTCEFILRQTFWGILLFLSVKEWQDYLWFIVSNSWWLHVWPLLSVYIVLDTPTACYGFSASPVLTRGYFSWFIASWILLDVTCTSFAWYLCCENLLSDTLCASLLLAHAKYYLLSFLKTLSRISSLCSFLVFPSKQLEFFWGLTISGYHKFVF